jgi:hypothetical protein
MIRDARSWPDRKKNVPSLRDCLAGVGNSTRSARDGPVRILYEQCVSNRRAGSAPRAARPFLNAAASPITTMGCENVIGCDSAAAAMLAARRSEMADKHRPERPAIDFGKGSREQTQSGAGPKQAADQIDQLRQTSSQGRKTG